MGAPLRTGEFRDSGEDGEEAQCSDDPFNFDLVPQPAAGFGGDDAGRDRSVEAGESGCSRGANLNIMPIEARQLECIQEV